MVLVPRVEEAELGVVAVFLDHGRLEAAVVLCHVVGGFVDDGLEVWRGRGRAGGVDVTGTQGLVVRLEVLCVVGVGSCMEPERVKILGRQHVNAHF